VTAKILLKARPTAAQLADRLAAPRPDGLELYLDTDDLATAEAMDGVVERLEALQLPSDFTLLVEGPIRSLDGEFFDLSRDSEADRELSRRIVDLSRRIGAVGANIHAIAPDPDPGSLTPENRATVLARAVGPTRYFADLALGVGIVPTVENMPPILRMRESGFYYSAIGMPPQDLVELTEAVPGLRVILDTSHTKLYLNVRAGVEDEADGHDLEPLRRFVRDVPGPDTLDEYVDALGDTLSAAHIANSQGLLGEALAYDDGEIDLDALLPKLAARARYLVAETLEADNNRALNMREAQRRMLRVLGRPAGV
jgi:hypothetical protein